MTKISILFLISDNDEKEDFQTHTYTCDGSEYI